MVAVLAGALTVPASAALPSISGYFLGTWTCSTSTGSLVVKAYGLQGPSTLGLWNAYVKTAPYTLGVYSEQYVQSGTTFKVTSKQGATTFTATSPGWDAAGDLTFTGTVTGMTPAMLDQRMTYHKVAAGRFTRTFATATSAAGPWKITSSESCTQRGVPAKP
jgi:hypothetical protein